MGCEGTPTACGDFEEDACQPCGCVWSIRFGWCLPGGTPDACDTHSTQADCELCGCDWVTGTNTEINIGDVWKDISEMKINIGDSWKAVTKAQINIGDAWKTIFG